MYVAYVHVHTCTWIHEELNDPLKLTMEGSNDDLEEEDENVGTFQVLFVSSSTCSYDVQSSLSSSLPSTSVPIQLLHVKHARTVIAFLFSVHLLVLIITPHHEHGRS